MQFSIVLKGISYYDAVMSLRDESDNIRQGVHAGMSPSPPLPEMLERLQRQAEEAADYFPPIIRLVRRPDTAPVSLRAESLCQAMDMVLREHMGKREFVVAYRAGPHTVLIDYTILKTFKLEARQEVFYDGFSLTHEMIQPARFAASLPLVEAHLENLRTHADTLREQIKVSYLAGVESRRTPLR